MGFFDFLNSKGPTSTVYDLLSLMNEMHGTELRLTPGAAPQAVVNDRVLPLSEIPLQAEDTRKLCCSLFTDEQKAEFEKNNKIEFPFGVKSLGRYKANIVAAEGRISGTIAIFDPIRK